MNLAFGTLADKVCCATERLSKLNLDAPCIGHSGGKDSVVTHWLVSQVFPNLPVVHTNKPGGDNAIHPDTLDFLYRQPFPIELWPRALGTNFKYKTQFDGSRISEFSRVDRSADFVSGGRDVNRQHLDLVVPDSMFGMTFVFPIYDWSDADVWAAIFYYDLPFSNEYAPEQAAYNHYRATR